jgi:hypothetical protein
MPLEVRPIKQHHFIRKKSYLSRPGRPVFLPGLFICPPEPVNPRIAKEFNAFILLKIKSHKFRFLLYASA